MIKYNLSPLQGVKEVERKTLKGMNCSEQDYISSNQNQPELYNEEIVYSSRRLVFNPRRLGISMALENLL